MSKEEVKLDLNHVVFIGRTFEEYMLMFNLTPEDLSGRRILDCPAGACSFTAIANKRGADVTAVDIAYYHDFEQLTQKGFDDIEHMMDKMALAQSNYIWHYFDTVEQLKQSRIQALTDCSLHMKEQPSRYVPAVLPVLPFQDNQFDITLSAHFLFMYAERLNYDFHLQAIQELLRVTSDELRIFPLADLSCNRYEHLDQLCDYLQKLGYSTEEIKVPYEFQKGANSMLVIKKRSTTPQL